MRLEIWKPIYLKNCEYIRYGISDLGRVKNLKTNKILKPEVDKDGYLRVNLCLDVGMKKHYFIHRLVAIAFIPNLENLPQVNHINGIKTDNYPENLEWCDCQYNITHAIKTGLRKNPPQGAYHWASLYPEETVIQICEMLQSGKYSIGDISKELGIPKSEINHIKSKKRWKYITEKYDFSNVKNDHFKYANLWEEIDFAIVNGMRRRDIVNYLISKGLSKNDAISAVRVRLRKIK